MRRLTSKPAKNPMGNFRRSSRHLSVSLYCNSSNILEFHVLSQQFIKSFHNRVVYLF